MYVKGCKCSCRYCCYNRLTFAKVITKIKAAHFLGRRCVVVMCTCVLMGPNEGNKKFFLMKFCCSFSLRRSCGWSYRPRTNSSVEARERTSSFVVLSMRQISNPLSLMQHCSVAKTADVRMSSHVFVNHF